MKKLVIAVGVLAALGAAVVVTVALHIGPIVKTAVETVGPKVAGVSVRLDSVAVSPLAGSVTLKGLVVGNPPGYKTPTAFELGEVHVAVSLKSLLSRHIRVRQVLIRGPVATYELGPGGSNVAVIQKKAEAAAGPSSAPAKPAASGKPSGPQRLLTIDDFRFEGGKVRLSAAFLGGKAVESPLPDIHLTDLGGAKGASPARVAAQAAKAVSADVAKAAVDAGRAVQRQAVDQAKKTFSGLRKLFK
ncbi:MAG: hypothetical protein KGL53_11720 [Elusimicrobia bacterium]|nr:hypothetical protein [Elusimicrobiota bacterium]